MKKKITRGLQIIVAIVLLSSCSKSGGIGGYGNNNNNTTGTTNKINIANMAFATSTTTVAKGTTVTWTNQDDMVHTVSADDNSFTSGNLNKGDSYSHTFNAVGTVAYHCKIHPGMTANVVVK